jgi:hypothetical protein
MHKSQCRNKKYEKKGYMTPSKINNSTIMDSSGSEINEISEKEFKRKMIRMINNIKQDTNEHLNEFQKNTNKQLN